jgi:hypothetical protein
MRDDPTLASPLVAPAARPPGLEGRAVADEDGSVHAHSRQHCCPGLPARTFAEIVAALRLGVDGIDPQQDLTAG